MKDLYRKVLEAFDIETDAMTNQDCYDLVNYLKLGKDLVKAYETERIAS